MLQKGKSTKKASSKKTAVKKGAAKKTQAKKETAKKATVKKAVIKKGGIKKAGAVKKTAVVKKAIPAVKKQGVSVSGVRFQSGGLNCEGRLYLPKGVKKPPVIIMAHGFGAEMDFGIPAYAGEFAKNGYAAFIFNYRYFGGSEGEPRQLISPKKQLEDWDAAIEFARNMDEVDGDRICIWGFSMSGGHVLVEAVNNANVKGFIAHVPFMDSMHMAKISGVSKVLKINAAEYRDLFYILTGKARHNIPIIGRPGDFSIMSTPGTYEDYMSLIPGGSGWKNEFPAISMMAILWYRPVSYISRIRCRGMVFTGAYDSLTDTRLVKKKFSGMNNVVLEEYKCDHFGFFKGEFLKNAVFAELKFLKGLF